MLSIRHRLAYLQALLLTGIAACGSPSVALAQDGLVLRPEKSLGDPQLRLGEDTPSFGYGDAIYGTTDTDTTFEGNAELRESSGVLKGDKIHFLQTENEVTAFGNVRLHHGIDVYSGPELRLSLDDFHGFFVAPEYSFGSNQGHGYADRAVFINRQQSEFYNPIYTTCPPDNYEWYMRADVLSIDQNTQEGDGTNATVYFKGYPILTAPSLSFPLSNGRKSGFLPPTMAATSNGGEEFVVPYYWNIAPNRDLTLYPDFMTKRGLQLGGDFRYLEQNYNGDLRLQDIADQVTKTNRYSFAYLANWSGVGDLAGWSAGLNLNKVSDPNYFIDFSRDIAAASTRTLPRDAELHYNNTYWSATALILNYQTLQIVGSPLVPPYNKDPEFSLHGSRLDYGGFDLNMDAILTRFSSPGLVGGDRFVFNPSISYPIVGAGWFMTPKVSYNTAAYNLTDTAVGQPSHINRSLMTESFDSGLYFDRDTELFGSSFHQTLEPRLFYVHTPYINQNAIPIFDSGLPDFNFSQLFAENAYTGYDRIADESQITAAVTTRFLNSETGEEAFRMAIGQRFFLSPQLVTLPYSILAEGSPGTTPVNSGKSDFLAMVSGEVFPNVTVDSGIDYSSELRGMERSNIGARWDPAPTEQISFEYRYLRGTFDQYDFSGQWRLGGGWYGVGRLNYSARDGRFAEALGGVEYQGCCWVLRFAAQNFVTGPTTSTTTFFVQLELNGFSQIGSNPLDSLRQNIVGFQPLIRSAPTAPPFTNYE